MKKTVITTNQVMADLLAAHELPDLLPDDITSQRVTAKSKYTSDYWRNILDAKVASGELIKVKCRNPQTKCPVFAYRPAPVAGRKSHHGRK